jgi:exodeoxyribonuclease V gamma subunit
MEIGRQGIVLFRASRLEALLDPLSELLRQFPPASVLAPQTVIAAHPGMRQWLSRALARRAGAGGILANVDITLPSGWLDKLALKVLGESAVAIAPYARETLRWRLFDLIEHSTDPALREYLQGADSQRRCFQLADRIAALFTRYLVYRPDWLEAWAAGRNELPEATFLAPLWRDVRARIASPHRGERLATMLRKLDTQAVPALPDEPLHVFGISHLAPTELVALRGVSRHRPVILYVPDPCREYWAGLRAERTRLRELAQQDAFSDASERCFLDEVGHPLLAGWGRLGQHFMLALADLGDVLADIRHGADEAPFSARSLPLLGQLQESIRQLDVGVLQPHVEDGTDRSLRIHACHTRLRELEVLRDALLREREERPDLQPSDVVVMAPDIQAYLPLLPSVFGVAGQFSGPLPYHLADVPVARSHPVLLAFDRLLDVPTSRLGMAAVMDLLRVTEIAQALRLDAGDVETIGNWLAEGRVAWALDGAFRGNFGVPRIHDHTFAWGMDRLLTSYVMGEAAGEESTAYRFADGSASVPVGGVQGPQAEALGALDRLLQQLAALHRESSRPRPLATWTKYLQQVVDELFRASAQDDDAAYALRILRDTLKHLGEEGERAEVVPDIDWSVLREVLRERLAAPADQSPFLLGAVTFCGMVPQRAIPFRVIAVLGLNDGEFPRNAGSGGIDPMVRHRRMGDRDTRSDDRYLFLETVMAARDALHLSFLGEAVRDGKARNPAAPLAELLAFLDERVQATARPWLIRHPLQPFDTRYFDGSDERLFSYRGDLAELAREPAPSLALPQEIEEPALEPEEWIAAWPEVVAYFRDPARHVLRQRVGLRLDALDAERLSHSEPLQAGFERRERVGRRLFLHCLADRTFTVPAVPPDWLRHGGLWPPGKPGEAAWMQQVAQVQLLLDRASDSELLRDGLPERAPLTIDALFGTVRVRGELGRWYRKDDVAWLLDVFPGRSEADIDFRDRVALFLEWALGLLSLNDIAAPRVVLLTERQETPWQDRLNRYALEMQAGDAAQAQPLREGLHARVSAVLALWARAQRQPVWYFPRTSWVAADRDASDEKITSTWEGHANALGERDYEPGYSQWLATHACFETGRPEFDELKRTAQSLHALIHPDVNAEHV